MKSIYGLENKLKKKSGKFRENLPRMVKGNMYHLEIPQ